MGEHGNSDTYADFKPHLTIAYLKRGRARKYMSAEHPDSDSSIRLDKIVFSCGRGRSTEHRLRNSPVRSVVAALRPTWVKQRQDRERGIAEIAETAELFTAAMGGDISIQTEAAMLGKTPLPESVTMPHTGRVDPSSVRIARSRTLQGIRLVFYIRHLDRPSIGDKFTFMTALKTIVCDVAETGEEPFTLGPNGKKEQVEAIISPLGVTNRMVMDFLHMTALGTALVDGKRRIAEAAREAGLDFNENGVR